MQHLVNISTPDNLQNSFQLIYISFYYYYLIWSHSVLHPPESVNKN